MSEQTQDNIPAESDTYGHQLTLFHRDEREVEHHDPWPDGPAGVKNGKDLCSPDDRYFCKSLGPKPVRPNQKDTEEGEHPDGLIEDKLGNHTPPPDPQARGPKRLQELCRGSLSTEPALLIIVFLLRLGWGRCLDWEGETTGEQPFEEDMPAIAKLGLEETVYGEF